jgi:transcriptional regulator GlxA family with amidase domain
VLPRYSFSTVPAIDWLIVPSGANYRTDMENETLVAWIRATGRRAQVVHSNCWGAFLLGAAGLLDGKQATTYPQSVDEFAQRFPSVHVRRDVQLVDDNGVVTSAGGVVSYDAALYLVEKHFGAQVARKVATGLVIDWDARRAGYRAAAVDSGS